MKKILITVIAIGVIFGIFYFVNKKEAISPVVVPSRATDEVEQANVENYLRANISKLSPVKAVLGGTWYVTSFTIDLDQNSGKVEYEDGHIQEIKNFSYVTDTTQEVLSLKID